MSSIYEVNRQDPCLSQEGFQFFLEHGYVVLTGFMSHQEVKHVHAIIEFLCDYELSHQKAHCYGHQLQRVWNLLNKHRVFHDLILSPQISLWMNEIFARETQHQKFFLSSLQANVLKPGAQAQILHIDTPVPDPIPNYPLKANTIWLLDDFNEHNGATELVPGSHRRSTRPPRIPTALEEKELRRVIAPSGSLIITHGALWHRSGSNNTTSPRCALLGSFAASYLREIACEEDMARFISPEVKGGSDPRLLDLIGVNHGLKPGNDYEIPGFFNADNSFIQKT
jgi:hypothetical protein